jgi:hypothetical protein
VEYVTLPGLARGLEAGDPPGNDHAYPEMVPSASLPTPENATMLPGFTVTLEAGLVMVATGA